MSEAEPSERDLAASDPDPDASGASSGARVSSWDGALVPRGGSFEGQVAIVGPTRIEGHVRGSLRGVGDLRIGSEARVEGRVECDALESDGEIVGPVSVRTRARFGPGARLDGDLQAPIVSLDEDAVWNGRALVGGAAADRDDQSAAEDAEGGQGS
jgi:cytoskeletal protein CcmA (bactofilin family)